jgi:Kef-type K+ transport system membrane component KefB
MKTVNQHEPAAASRETALAFYAVMVSLAAAGFWWIRSIGNRLPAPHEIKTLPLPIAVPAPPVVSPNPDALFHLLVALVVIVLAARVMGRLFEYIYQPAVVGEVLGGIMLGPSLLGHIAPGVFHQLLPASIAPFVGLHAQLGIILYMFIVGLELDTRELRQSVHATIAISHASIVVPFLLGSGLALVLYPLLATGAVSFTVFALFVGVAMSITAFPVLARILTDRKISRTRMGVLALTCAAIDDVTAWCLLAVVAGIAQAHPGDVARTLALTLAFVTLMLVVVAPVIRRVLPALERESPMSRRAFTIVLIAALVSATTTEYIGIHGLFGAFLFGALIPSGSRVAADVRRRLEDLVGVLFLPAFFAYTGLRTEIGLISGWTDWLCCAAIVLVACVGKFGGTAIAARLTGIKWRDASALGVLMNTRGLVELIVLNIGLDLHVISPRLFTMLVVMAIATTVMTTPILHLIVRRHPWMESERVSA